jgi:protein phosphatase
VTLGRSAGITDTGRRRRRNEDAYVCRPPLFAVADGMGGAQAGEVASRLAAAVLQESDAAETGEQRVIDLVQEANRRVYTRSNEDRAVSGMGTTMTLALVDARADTVAIGHVGDSRAYRVRHGQLEQLTEDHSLVQELVRSGKLSPEEAELHPQRSVITRALGTDPDVDVDTFTVETEPGDLYLICSDGLTTMVSDGEILALLADSRDDLDGAVRALVDTANREGGEDNITVVLFEIRGGDETGEEAGDTVQLPPVAEDEGDDEDTLSGLEAVPAVDTAVISAEDVRAAIDAQELREAEEQVPVVEERRRRRMRRHGAGGGSRWPALLVVLLVVLAVAALVAWGFLR